MTAACAVDDCERSTWSKGLCGAHYKRAQRGLPLPGTVAPRTPRLGACSFDGCANADATGNLCRAHIMQIERGGELRPLRPFVRVTRCSIAFCDGDVKGATLCATHLRRTAHGLSPVQLDMILRIPACEICETPAAERELFIDHDHGCCPGKTSCGECIRGIICGLCNSAIGYLQDDPKLVARALAYLTPSVR